MPTKKGEQKTGDHVKFKTAIVLSWCMVTTWEKLSYLVFQKWIWIVPVKYHQKNLVFFKQKSYLRVSTDAMRRKCRTVIYQLLIMMCQAVVIPYMLPGSNRPQYHYATLTAAAIIVTNAEHNYYQKHRIKLNIYVFLLTEHIHGLSHESTKYGIITPPWICT